MLADLQIFTTFLAILWLDVFRINPKLLKLFGFKPWSTKLDLPYFLKWMACYFCTSFWIGVFVAVGYYLFDKDLQNAVLLIMLNTIVSRMFDRLINQNK